MRQGETFQQHFERRFSDLPVSVEKSAPDLLTVAKHVWFDGFVPDLSPLTDVKCLMRAAYVVDYLAANPLMPAARKKVLKQCLADVSLRLKSVTEVDTFYLDESQAVKTKNRDVFAKRWKLASGMKPKLLGLLDLQRRANLPSGRSVA